MQGVEGGTRCPRAPPASGLRRGHDVNDIVQGLSLSSYGAVFCIGLASSLQAPGGTLACYLYHSEKILTHTTPPGLTELYINKLFNLINTVEYPACPLSASEL